MGSGSLQVATDRIALQMACSCYIVFGIVGGKNSQGQTELLALCQQSWINRFFPLWVSIGIKTWFICLMADSPIQLG